MASPTQVILHPRPTWCGKRYHFTPKHHGGDRSQSAWVIADADEFLVFDCADFHDLSDEKGNLYGVLLEEDGELKELGFWGEQIAEFPFARAGETWHGYPCWALSEDGPSNRRNMKSCPSRSVFQKMLEHGMITKQQKKRFEKGQHA